MARLLTLDERVDRLARIVCGMLYIDDTMDVDFKVLVDLREALVHALKMKGYEKALEQMLHDYEPEMLEKQEAREKWIDERIAEDIRMKENAVERRKLLKRALYGAGSSIGIFVVKQELAPLLRLIHNIAQEIVGVFS